MKHDPIRVHPIGCPCDLCRPRATLAFRPIVIAAIGATIPVYGLAWAIWTQLP